MIEDVRLNLRRLGHLLPEAQRKVLEQDVGAWDMQRAGGDPPSTPTFRPEESLAAAVRDPQQLVVDLRARAGKLSEATLAAFQNLQQQAKK